MSSERIRQLLKSNKSRRPYLTDMDMPGFDTDRSKLPPAKAAPNKKPPVRGDFPDKGKVR